MRMHTAASTHVNPHAMTHHIWCYCCSHFDVSLILSSSLLFSSCIGNSGEIPAAVTTAIEKGELVASAVLSGNRNFEGRVHPATRANYLASPPLVVAYAIAGNVNFDFEKTPLGKDQEGKDVFLREIWPTTAQVQEVVEKNVTCAMFKEVYANISEGAADWQALQVQKSLLYEWSEKSTYIHHPPFFQTMTEKPAPVANITDAFCLLNLGDSITTDHISPAGDIAKNSPAAKYLAARGIDVKEYNTYGSRRGNDEIMVSDTQKIHEAEQRRSGVKFIR